MAMAIKIAMMSTTTISSMRVNPPSSPSRRARSLAIMFTAIPLWFVGCQTARSVLSGTDHCHIGHAPWQLEQKTATNFATSDSGRRGEADWGRAPARRRPHRRSSGSGCSTASTAWSRGRRRSATRPSSPARTSSGPTGLEASWPTIREELDEVLDYRDALPNFQDISTDQESITDDDRWKTFFLYGFGFRSRHQLRAVPGDRPARRVRPRHEDGDVLDPLAAQAHPRPLRSLQGHRPVPPRAEGARAPRAVPDPGRRRDRHVGRRCEPASSTTPTSTRCGTTPTASGWCSSSTSCARCGSR